ncbi:MAG: DUF6705 family protein [Lacibacter sp.]
MKKYLFIIIFGLFVSTLSIAQMPTPPQPNGNITNPTLDKFVGTWLWTNGVVTLKIILKKENILLPFPENSRADAIVGFHIFKQGNNIIESSMGYIHTNHNDKYYSILGGNSGVGFDNPNEIGCSIRNIAKNKSGELTLIINSSLDKLVWTLKNYEGVKIGPYDYSFSYPRTFVLIRQ